MVKIVAVSNSTDDCHGAYLEDPMFHGDSDHRERVTDEFSIYGYQSPIGTMKCRHRLGDIPPILVQDAHLVLESSIAAALATVPHLRFRDVEFTSLVTLPPDLTFERAKILCKKAKVRFVTASDVFKVLPDSRPEGFATPRYRELFVPVLDRILEMEEIIPSETYSSMRILAPRYREYLPRYVSSSVFETYPMLFSGGGFLMLPWVFDILKPHLPAPHFCIFEMEMSDQVPYAQKTRVSAG